MTKIFPRHHSLLLTLLLLGLLSSCKNDAPAASQATTPSATSTPTVKKDPRALPDWAKNATIYEVNVRQYTPEGTFEAFSNHLPRLQKMGVDILWFMPIYPISKTKRKGSLGSYYAVSDYRGINPEYGTMKDFDKMVGRIHDLGMHLILDWVPNHTGWDHRWISTHRNWYTQNDLGEIIDPIDPGTGKSWGWTDVADLNFDNPQMRKAMIDQKLFWINQHGVDGFREDVAHGVPDLFWDEVAEAVFSTGKDVFMLAEAEVPSHRNSGNFHMGYGWSAHHLLNEIAHGKKSAQDLDAWLAEDRKKFQKGMAMHFTSNHDENTWAGTVFDRMGAAHKTLAALTFVFDGMPLIYGGQEEPLKKRLEFFEKDDIGFKSYAYSDFYLRLATLKEENQAIWNGSHGGALKKMMDHPDIFAFEREKNGDKVIGIFNLSAERQVLLMPKEIKGTDLMTDSDITWKKGLEVPLNPWQYYIMTP